MAPILGPAKNAGQIHGRSIDNGVPTNGQVLIWDDSSKSWKLGSAVTITTTLTDDDTKIPTSKAVKDVTDGKIPKTTNITALNETGIADGEICVFNPTNKDIRTSDKTIVTTIGADDTTVPTSKAVKDTLLDAFGVAGTTNTDRDANTTNHGLLLKAVAPASGLLSVPGIANGETTYALKPLFDTTNPAMDGTASAGTQVIAARRDHVHASDTSRLAIATANVPKRSIFLSCVGGWLPTTSPAGAVTKTETSTNKVNFNGALFAAGASDIYKEFGMPMPANYDGGTVTAIPYIFVPTSTDASDHTIKLSLAGVSFSSGDAGDAAYGTKQESTITAAASLAGKVVVGAATSAITIAGTPIGADWIQWRVGRTGDDTYTGDITLLGWLISYSTDTYSDV